MPWLFSDKWGKVRYVGFLEHWFLSGDIFGFGRYDGRRMTTGLGVQNFLSKFWEVLASCMALRLNDSKAFNIKIKLRCKNVILPFCVHSSSADRSVPSAQRFQILSYCFCNLYPSGGSWRSVYIFLGRGRRFPSFFLTLLDSSYEKYVGSPRAKNVPKPT